MSAPTQTSGTPKRRRLQFSLRTMLALTTVVCVWLGYNARQYQAEEAVVELARSLDPKVEAKWNSPGWWRKIFGDKPAGIFGRLHYLGLQGPQLSIEKLSGLPLDRLTSLQTLALINTEIWEEDAENWRIELNGQFRIQPMNLQSISSRSLYKPVEKYFEQPTPDTKAQLRRAVLAKGRVRSNFASEPGELSTDTCGFGSRATTELDEEYLLLLLTHKDEELAVLAARTLWRLHSRRYASEAIEFARKLQSVDQHAMLVKQDILSAVRPESILKQLSSENLKWGSWLAALNPDAKLVPAHIAAVDEDRATLETIYALGQTNDPRAVPTLFKLLSIPGNGLARRSLMQRVDDSLEAQLIAGLKDGNDCFVHNAIGILNWTSSSRALPELRRLDEEWKLRPETLLYENNIVSEAIIDIEARTREAAEINAVQPQPAEQQ